MQTLILEILDELVACDTQNPPREISVHAAIFDVIKRRLASGFRFETTDHARGRVSLLAVRGTPATMFNVHLDTVPVSGQWNLPPLKLSVVEDRAYGRGTCDIKGAAACLIAAASSGQADVAILFTTDEEGAESCCVEKFCEAIEAGEQNRFAQVIVAEPTECNAVTGHRGYISSTGDFEGVSGHTSQYDQLASSANHRATRWIVDALSKVADFEKNELAGQSCCFNIGRIDGGIKNNMIADACRVSWSARMPPGSTNESLLEYLIPNTAILESAEHVTWNTTFDGAPLPGDPSLKIAARKYCELSDLAPGNDVDFWTEAAIFAGFGFEAIVLGPGNIAQAHTADEWVSVEQLVKCADIYARLMKEDN